MFKKKIFKIVIGGMLLMPTMMTNSTLPHVKDFVKLIGDAAIRIQAKTGIDACFMVAQAALETGWGKDVVWVKKFSDGAKVYSYNLFNIKWYDGCGYDGGWKTVPEDDASGHEYQSKERFKIYSSFEESMEDWLRTISTLSRYADAWINRGDIEKLAYGIEAGGWATSKDEHGKPNYAKSILSTAKCLYIDNNDDTPVINKMTNQMVHSNKQI
jgi:peptidoglycan hydrolase FlgJ